MNRTFPSFFLAALRTRSSPFGPLSRLGVRRWLDCRVFSSVSGLPSTPSADGLPPLFGCFVGTTPLYDSPALKRRAAVHVGLIAHRLLPPARLPFGCGRLRGLSVLARGVSMHAWGLRLRRVAAHSHLFAHRVLSFRLAGHRRHPDSAISELNTQPAYSPVQRFKCGLSTALAWLGARVVCCAFLCMTLSFTTPRRFIPTLSRLEARSTQADRL